MIRGLLKLLCPGFQQNDTVYTMKDQNILSNEKMYYFPLFFIFIENVTHSLELVFKKRVSTAGPPLLNLSPEQALEELSK
jgi:hypothetical protein